MNRGVGSKNLFTYTAKQVGSLQIRKGQKAPIHAVIIGGQVILQQVFGAPPAVFQFATVATSLMALSEGLPWYIRPNSLA